jgi:hypothetical protein
MSFELIKVGKGCWRVYFHTMNPNWNAVYDLINYDKFEGLFLDSRLVWC